MNYRNRGLKMLGVSLVASLAMLAFSAVAAQADYLIEGKTFAALGIEQETFSISSDAPSKLVASELSTEINCGKTMLTGGTILLLGVSHGNLTLEECTFLDSFSSEEVPACTVDNFTLSLLGQTITHNGVKYILFKPTTGGVFTRIKVLGKECVVAGEHELKGTFASSINAGSLATHTLSLANAALATLLGDSLSYSGFAASFTSPSLLMKLTGAFAGKAWSVI